MAQRVYVSRANVIDGKVAEASYLWKTPIGSSPEFLLLHAEDAERVRTLITAMQEHADYGDGEEALRLLEPSK